MISRPRVLAFFAGLVLVLSGAPNALAAEEAADAIDLPIVFMAGEIPPQDKPENPTPPPIANPPKPCLDCAPAPPAPGPTIPGPDRSGQPTGRTGIPGGSRN